MNCESDRRDILGEIEEAAGLEAAQLIAKLRGGTQVHIPRRCADNHWLVNAVGRDAADAICNHFSVAMSGERIIIPMGADLARHAKRMQIINLLNEGHSASHIARTVGVHIRTVYRHRAGQKRRLRKLGLKVN